MTTKEQERKALEQIRKIVAGLGEGSYIATAFEGCFEIAAENIENDWACSMKQRAEAAEKKAAKLELDNRDLRLAVQKAKSDASATETALHKRIGELEASFIGADDLCDCSQLVSDALFDTDKEMRDAATKIVKLAEDPTSLAFQDAVKVHRAMESRAKHYMALSARLGDAQRAIKTGA